MPRDLADDVRLLQQMASGSVEAFEAIYKRYWKRVYYGVRFSLRDDQLAEDITQEIFVKLWINKTEFQDFLSLRAYLSRAAKNAILNILRREKNQARYISEALHTHAALQLEEAATAEHYDTILKVGLDHLAPRQREIMKMSRLQGLPNKKIAENLGITPETVKRTITNALKIMHEQFTLRGININKKIS